MGGAEKVALEQAKILSDEYKIDIISEYFIKDNMDTSFANKIICLNQKNFILFKFFNFFKNIIFLKKYCLKNKVDLIFSQTTKANLTCCIAKKTSKKFPKLILMEHSYQPIRNFRFYYLVKKYYKFADLIISVSANIDYILKNKFKLKSTVVLNNFLNTKEIEEKSLKEVQKKHTFLFKEKNKISFINIGRLSPEKNQKQIIKSFIKFHSSNPNTQILIIGDGKLYKKLKKYIKRKNASEYVHLLGQINNIFPYLKRSEYFILGSKYEGYPIVLLEALFSGNKIISTDCKSGPREILTPELNINQKINYPYIGERGVLVDKTIKLPSLNLLKEMQYPNLKNLTELNENYEKKLKCLIKKTL